MKYLPESAESRRWEGELAEQDERPCYELERDGIWKEGEQLPTQREVGSQLISSAPPGHNPDQRVSVDDSPIRSGAASDEAL